MEKQVFLKKKKAYIWGPKYLTCKETNQQLALPYKDEERFPEQ